MNRLAAIALATLLLSGCAWLKGGESNAEPMTELTDFKATAKVKHLWGRDIGADLENHYVVLRPVIVGDAIYTVDREGVLSAHARDSGKRLWKVELDLPVSAGLGQFENYLFLGTQKGEVVAMDRRDGKRLWSSRVSSEVWAAPAADKERVVVEAIDGKLFGLKLADGTLVWTQERSEPSLSLRGTSTPTLAGGVAYAGFANGKLGAFKLADGNPLWETVVAEPHGRNEIERLVDVDTQPLVTGGTVYCAGYQGKLVAVNAESGSVIWARDISTYLGIDKDNAYVYAVDAAGEVIAFDAATGARAWKQDKLRARKLSAPTAFSKFIAVGDAEGYVHFLRKEDGAFAARYRVGGDPIRARILAVDERVFVLDQEGELVALQVQ